MKRGIIILIVMVLVLITAGIWFFSISGNLKPIDLVSFGVILTLVVFAGFFGYKRLTSAKRGEPAEDELSKKVMRRAASTSYYISIYLWLAVMYFSDKVTAATHTMIGAGILGMALVFAVCWIIFNFTGIRNE